MKILDWPSKSEAQEGECILGNLPCTEPLISGLKRERLCNFCEGSGLCDFCWTFSATGSLEGQTFWKMCTLIPLGGQNLVVCSQSQDKEGCDGGYKDYAFHNGQRGLDSEESQYYAKVESCKYEPEYSAASVIGFVDTYNTYKWEKAVAVTGSISVRIDAAQDTF